VLLGLPAPGWSQSSAPSNNQSEPQANNLVAVKRGLKISVVRGDGVVNSINGKAAPVIVEVRDENEAPVRGAEVVFQLPYLGPSGTFYGWMRTHTARTDEQGRVTSPPFTPSTDEGPFEIAVTASAPGRQGAVKIAQSNSRSGATPAAKSSHKTLWIVLAVAAGAAIGGGVAATRGGDSTSAVTTVPVTVSPGVVTVGGPR
jgi:hypothetical protein